MKNHTFTYVTYIDTSAEALWEALTSPDFTRQYWGGRSIQSDWTVGSRVVHLRENGEFDWHGEILQCERPEVLSYSFQGPEDDDPESRVTFELEPYGSVIRLTVTHTDLADRKEYNGISQGWPAILSSLKSLLERGEPLTYPWRRNFLKAGRHTWWKTVKQNSS
jgi:uncharacterized protein YndB with AHSA1/START domain